MDAMQFPVRSAFLALPLDADSQTQFYILQQSLEPFREILRFQNPLAPHLTLQFWQTLMQIEYVQVVKQSEKIAARHTCFSLKTTGIQTFSSRGRDHVLYLDVAFSDELARLKKSCPWPNVKPFAPHITIARISHPEKFGIWKKRILKAIDNSEMLLHFDRLRLYGEIEGQKQTPLRDFLLQN